MRRAQILVIDSGLGGLTVLADIRRLLPDIGVTYIADNAAFPYGQWSPGALAERLVRMAASACKARAYDAVVLACNTASTTSLAALRSALAIPVVGVVPAIKPAGEQSTTRIIGLLATPATVDTPYVGELVAQFASDCHVIRVGPPDLADLAETHCGGRTVDEQRLSAILSPFFGADAPDVDTVVLGCTHYPLLLDLLRPLAPKHVRWLQPGPAVARRLAQVLRPELPQRPAEDDTIVFTAALTLTDAQRRLLDRHGLHKVEQRAALPVST